VKLMVLVGRIRNSVMFFYGRKGKKKEHNGDEDEGKRGKREREKIISLRIPCC